MKILVYVAFVYVALFANEGQKVFETKCLSCHKSFIDMPTLKVNFLDKNNQLLKLTAPTLNQLSYRLKQRIGDPRGDKDMHRMEVSAFMSDYVLNPDREKSVCLDDVMKHFKTMPSLKGQISEDELEAVGEYLYDFDKTIEKEISGTYEGFENTLKLAQKEHKIIMIEAMSETCHYCRKMETKVLVDKEISNVLEKDFITLKIDIGKRKLPLGLNTELTPTFIFIDENAKLIMQVPGAWDKKNFLEILQEVKMKKDKK